MDWSNNRNLTMLVDFYELTMGNGYIKEGVQDKRAVFDMFFRKIPDQAGFAIFAGLEQLVGYLKNLKFSQEDIDYLRSKNLFSEEFLDYLKNFHFSCNVWAMKEGTPIFPNEPVVIVEGPVIQAQLIETMVLLSINFQSLVTTKASRICRAAQGRPVMEFGSRRAQSYDAAVLGARAAYIGGCSGTACAISDREYQIPALGTIAHSWVQMFPTEYDAFKAYAETYPDSCTLLVDTYNVLKSGVPNAIKVFDEVLAPMGYRPKGIRIDSGDIAYLSKKARKMLDAAGYPDCTIVASNSLDEYLIRDLLLQGAKVDSFGVGENLITSKSDPVFGGVYKLVAVEDENGVLQPRIKLSETAEKITTPNKKMVYRLYKKDDHEAVADYIAMYDEKVPDEGPITLFDPVNTWKSKTFTDVDIRPMLVEVFRDGECVYELPGIEEIKAYCQDQIDHLWEEVKRFENPHRYYVDLSEKLWSSKHELLKSFQG
ncbi:MAG TPA: nicotinate phosphoribosyltransferase [Candidatus Faecivivens stercoripullorum]|uniref:Nicotinate phosphoribosyltransferase n=1 Tax=Candidatus Faecivivens stercoripullorum TaxID=2840805 RepID=A0A9D1H7T5_9FIRM|nr:nicotinate phosphoribosyltransferase [Candidatus Faecivivens stercoripullorum]